MNPGGTDRAAGTGSQPSRITRRAWIRWVHCLRGRGRPLPIIAGTRAKRSSRGEKILQWSETVEDALATMLYLHDRYALDGDDPNTYTNILWCFGLHDRPWPEKPVFGTIRSMVRSGMERKTDVKSYIREIQFVELTGKEQIA
jgi:hypothetical protein